MSDFLISSELWSNIIGGVFSALLLAGLYWAVNFNKRQNLKELVKVQKGIVELLNDELSFEHLELNEWSNKAFELHEIAIKTAEKISPAAGALIEVTDGVKSGNPKDIVIPILNQTNERIRVILKANL